MTHRDEARTFGLTSSDPSAPAPVLAGVQASGRLDGVLFELTLRQIYRNPGSRVLEVVYTFPLPPQAVLLGFASELDGERQAGSIVARREAERRYEDALAEGDAPVLLEALAGGLHTANIGNLQPGDEIVLEVRYAQLLAFEQGRLRLAIPTTIAPRYGSAEQSGLQPQQVPAASLEAEYALALSVTVAGVLAGGTVECATHRFTREPVAGGVLLTLADGASLDRDVVIVVQPREPLPSLVVQAEDTVRHAAPVVAMAALQPPPLAQRERLALKLLVDCSGSMAGDSIASARAALRGALAGLGENDQVSISRFGSAVQHVQAPTECTPRVLRLLGQEIDTIQADLGGTEMEAALGAVFELPMEADEVGADVLLVTDGEIWQADELIAAARASGHRIFAIGVGSAPAEGVLRALAEATGGACEFATPGEALEAAAQRMLVRIRQQPWRDVRTEWGTETAWQTTLPASVFGGDTVMAFAGMAALPSSAGVRMLGTNDRGETVEIARGEAHAPCPGDSLARIAASRRMEGVGEAEALSLALDYQLLGKQTHCVLVHVRAAEDKAVEHAELHRVSSMVAAGWGGTGRVRGASQINCLMSVGGERSPNLASPRMEIVYSVSDIDTAAPPYLGQARLDAQPATLVAMALFVRDHLADGGTIQGLAARAQGMTVHADAQHALDDVVQQGSSVDEAWVLLAHWINSRTNGLADAALATLLRRSVDALDPAVVARAVEVFERRISGYPNDGWTLSRMQRLRRALTVWV